MNLKKYNLFDNPFWGMFFCVLYLSAVQLSVAFYLAKQYMAQDFQDPNFLSNIDIIVVLMLWLPFCPILFYCITKKEWKSVYAYSKKIIQKHWLKFVIYFLY